MSAERGLPSPTFGFPSRNANRQPLVSDGSTGQCYDPVIKVRDPQRDELVQKMKHLRDALQNLEHRRAAETQASTEVIRQYQARQRRTGGCSSTSANSELAGVTAHEDSQILGVIAQDVRLLGSGEPLRPQKLRAIRLPLTTPISCGSNGSTRSMTQHRPGIGEVIVSIDLHPAGRQCNHACLRPAAQPSAGCDRIGATSALHKLGRCASRTTARQTLMWLRSWTSMRPWTLVSPWRGRDVEPPYFCRMQHGSVARDGRLGHLP